MIKRRCWIASSRLLLAMTVLVMSASAMTACGNKGKLKTPAEISKEQAKKEKEAAKKEKKKKENAPLPASPLQGEGQ